MQVSWNLVLLEVSGGSKFSIKVWVFILQTEMKVYFQLFLNNQNQGVGDADTIVLMKRDIYYVYNGYKINITSTFNTNMAALSLNFFQLVNIKLDWKNEISCWE